MEREVAPLAGARRRGIIEGVARKKRCKPEASDPLAAYRRIRKPMPPPERIEEDRRRKAEEDEARREMEKGR